MLYLYCVEGMNHRQNRGHNMKLYNLFIKYVSKSTGLIRVEYETIKGHDRALDRAQVLICDGGWGTSVRVVELGGVGGAVFGGVLLVAE